MISTDTPPTTDSAALATEVVAAYVSKNSVPTAELPALIASVHAAFSGLGKPIVQEPEKATPAISVRKSITPDHLISLEDGRKYRTLKRHLARLGLTPVQYRAKWGLPADYPMTAPNYAKMRSELARKAGLGRKALAEEPATAAGKSGAKGARKRARRT